MKIHPLKYLRDLRKELANSFTVSLREQKVSKSKLEKFTAASKGILEPLLKSIPFASTSTAPTDWEKHTIVGRRALMEKASFADEQEFNNLNAHSIIAEDFSRAISSTILRLMDSLVKKSFNLQKSDLSKAIEHLAQGRSDLIVIKCSHSDDLPIFNVDVKKFPYSHPHHGGSCLYVIEKDDTPMIGFDQVDKEVLNKYAADILLPDFNVYATITDLNLNNNLFLEYSSAYPDKDLRTNVVVGIFLKMQIYTKPNPKMIRLQLASEYTPKTILNSLGEVKWED
ncbi:MAG TPA: hypothetical protein VFV37_01570 [Luteibaculaceae bacterium]|nr:hypothetical protein [Luteibaculaceae bacterium]